MRPTVHDVARLAGVSLSTVDRVLNGRSTVRASTVAKVHEAMEHLNYRRDMAAANMAKRRIYRFLFVVPGGANAFMRSLQEQIEGLAGAAVWDRVEISVETVPPFDAAALADKIREIDPKKVDGLAFVATDSPPVRAAVAALVDSGVHVVTMVSDLPMSKRGHFVGIENVVAGRTAAGLLGRFCHPRVGKLAVIAGSMVVRDHIERRLGFEQVIRPEFPNLEILPTIEGLDDADVVAEKLSAVLRQNSDIIGIYSLGAGNRGLIRAVADVAAEQRPSIVVHELTPHTSEALLSGMFDAAINQDTSREAQSAVRVLRALSDGVAIDVAQERIGIEVYLRDNLPHG